MLSMLKNHNRILLSSRVLDMQEMGEELLRDSSILMLDPLHPSHARWYYSGGTYYTYIAQFWSLILIVLLTISPAPSTLISISKTPNCTIISNVLEASKWVVSKIAVSSLNKTCLLSLKI